jgi:hypothetical protein
LQFVTQTLEFWGVPDFASGIEFHGFLSSLADDYV